MAKKKIKEKTIEEKKAEHKIILEEKYAEYQAILEERKAEHKARVNKEISEADRHGEHFKKGKMKNPEMEDQSEVSRQNENVNKIREIREALSEVGRHGELFKRREELKNTGKKLNDIRSILIEEFKSILED